MEPNPQKKSWRKRIVIGGIALVALAGVGVPGALSQDYGGMQRFGMACGDGVPGMDMQANFLKRMAAALQHGASASSLDYRPPAPDAILWPAAQPGPASPATPAEAQTPSMH